MLKAFTTTDSKSGVTSLHLRPLKRGEQYVMARLGGATGPLLAMRKVWEFTLDTPALESIIVDATTGIGTTTLTMRPLAPNVDFNFEMAGHTGTFAGGATAFKVNTSATQSTLGEPGFQAIWDEATGETIGKFSFDIEMPANETLYCYTMQPTQEDPIPVGEKGLINGTGCALLVEQIFIYKKDTTAHLLQTILVKEKDAKGKKTAYIPEIISDKKGAPPNFSQTTPIDCSQKDKTPFPQWVKAADNGEDGKFAVMVDGTIFSDRVVIFDVKIDPINYIFKGANKSVFVDITQDATATVELTLSRAEGTAGDATFANGKKDFTITRSSSVFIKGTEVSEPVGTKTVALKAVVYNPSRIECDDETNKTFEVKSTSLKGEIHITQGERYYTTVRTIKQFDQKVEFLHIDALTVGAIYTGKVELEGGDTLLGWAADFVQNLIAEPLGSRIVIRATYCNTKNTDDKIFRTLKNTASLDILDANDDAPLYGALSDSHIQIDPLATIVTNDSPGTVGQEGSSSWLPIEINMLNYDSNLIESTRYKLELVECQESFRTLVVAYNTNNKQEIVPLRYSDWTISYTVKHDPTDKLNPYFVAQWIVNVTADNENVGPLPNLQPPLANNQSRIEGDGL